MDSHTSPVTHTQAVAAPSSADVHTAGSIASANAPKGVTTNTKVNSLADLKEKAPEVYQKMIEGIAMHICGEMRAHQDRLKKLMRENNA